jgi:hypothetical protein
MDQVESTRNNRFKQQVQTTGVGSMLKQQQEVETTG